MDIFAELERFFSEVVYPNRWPILAGVLLAAAAVTAIGYGRGWHRTLWRHRLATALIVVPLVGAAIPLGNYLLSPLIERSYANEASPLVAAADVPATVATPTTSIEPASMPASSFAARVAFAGQFRGADDFHFGRGKALLIETAPGRYALRVEDFSVRNGPDLFVYLSPGEAGDDEGALNLGRLKATDGAFNYDVPAGTDVSQYRTAIVWCRRFSVLFAAAPLMEA